MDPRSRNGLIEVLSANQLPLVGLRSVEGDGRVTTLDRTGTKAIVMGYLGKNLGLFAHIPETNAIILLTQPLRIDAKTAKPLPPKGQPSASGPTKQQSEKKETPPANAGK
jgi:hypothetical protein